MTQNFEQLLHDALQTTPASERAMQETAARAAVLVRAEAPVQRLRFTSFLGTQVRFIGWKIWLLQALVLFASNRALSYRLGEVYFLDATIAMRCLSCLSVLVLLTALPVLVNAAHYHMHELEAPTYFSSLQLLAAKFIIVGIGDAGMLTGLWLYALTCTPLSASVLPLCLVAPFLAATAGLLTLLNHATPRVVLLGCSSWCSLLGASGLLAPRWLFLADSTVILSLSLCALLLLYCFFALRKLWQQNAFTELQLFS